MSDETSIDTPLRIAYADPPYINQARRLYGCDEIDHEALIADLKTYDGWALSCTSTSLAQLLPMADGPGVRVCAWVKPMGKAFPNSYLMWAWEPVIVKPARRKGWPGRYEEHGPLMDWTMCHRRTVGGVKGSKPYEFCRWLFGVLGARKGDDFFDMFRGSGAVADSWFRWSGREQQAPLRWGCSDD